MAIPRRSSVYDDGFDFEASRHWRIYVDGAEQKRVVSFDVDGGTVIRHQLDAAGKVQLDDSGESVAVETIHGVVTVTDERG